MLETKIAQYAQESVDAGAAESAAGLERVLQIQADWILNQGVGMSENYDYTYGEYSACSSCLPGP